MALSIPSSAIQAREGGFDFKMVMQNEVAASEAPDSQAVFVRADSKVSRVADLKGKRIAVNNIGSQMWLSMVEVLDRAGVDQDDVQFLEMPFPNMREALANDQVDAVFNVEPFTSDMAASGDFQAISYAATEALPGQPVGAFWATTQWYEENEQAAEKFVAAMDEVNTYLASHPDETNQLISEYTGIDLPVIEKMTPINWDSEVDRSTVQELLDLMRERGLLSKPVEAESVLFPLATQ
jgi:NitT/TauT family transport system substrate-binding protein